MAHESIKLHNCSFSRFSLETIILRCFGLRIFHVFSNMIFFPIIAFACKVCIYDLYTYLLSQNISNTNNGTPLRVDQLPIDALAPTKQGLHIQDVDTAARGTIINPGSWGQG